MLLRPEGAKGGADGRRRRVEARPLHELRLLEAYALEKLQQIPDRDRTSDSLRPRVRVAGRLPRYLTTLHDVREMETSSGS